MFLPMQRRFRAMTRICFATAALVLGAAAASAQAPFTNQLVVGGLNRPVGLTHAGDGSGRLFVIEKAGRVKIIKNGAVLPTLFIDVTSKVTLISDSASGAGSEQGLLGIAFHPNYETNGRFFLSYTRRADGYSVLEEYKVSAGNPDVADPTAVQFIFNGIFQPAGNHNGGHIAFGPDGYLYYGLGDGGGANNQYGFAQDPNSLLSKILRVDVDSASPYAIPPDNPLVGDPDPNKKKEAWAWGFRNPWRWSFDRGTGRLICGDVGQNIWEEIDIVEKGKNYGWSTLEGNHCFPANVTNCSTTGFTAPIWEYQHTSGRCSVTGGYVYRGSKYASLQGMYLFADYCTGEIWGLTETSPGNWTSTQPLDLPTNITSFGEDEEGEIYIVNGTGLTSGQIQRIVGFDPTPTPTASPSPTASPTPSVSPTESVSPTPSETPSPSPSDSPTPSASPSPTETETPTATATATLTATETATATATATATLTATATPAPVVSDAILGRDVVVEPGFDRNSDALVDVSDLLVP